MYDFTQDFTDYQKLVPNAELTVKTPPTGTTQPQGYDFNKDLESYRKIAPEDNGLSEINDALKIKALKQQQAEEQKRTEEEKKKLQIAADLQLQSGYTPTPESVSSAQMTEGAKKSLAGMQDKILGKAGVITQRFGNRNPIEKFSGGVNYGTDIGVPKGTKVSVPPGKWKVLEAYAGAEEGKSATNRGYGNSILVQNQETGEKMRFSHLSQVGVRPGEIVDGNKIVGAVGSTGNSTGPHLDLEMYDRSGRLIDILNTPYSSYLGLGQGGGSGKGGGNPMMDKITQVGRQALESAVPLLQVPQRSKEFLYDPQTSRIAPQSPLWELSDITNIQDPKERRRRLIDWSSNMSMALSTGKTPETSYIKGEEQGTRNILGGVHNPGASSEKGIFNVIIKDAKGNKIGNRIYEDSISAQRAIERIALEPNQQALVQKLDVMPGPDGLAPLDVKKAKIGKELIKPSTGGEIETLYRGEGSGGMGSKANGNYYSTDKEFAREFTRLMSDKEIKQIKVPKNAIYEPKELPFAGNEKEITQAINEARQKGFNAIRVSEGAEQPNSVFIIDPKKPISIPSSGGEIGGTTLYHGSDKVFDEMKVGQPTKRRMMMGEYDTTSHGMFFTPDKKIAGEYGKNVGEYRVNVKNPLDFRDRKNDAIFNEFDKIISNDPTIIGIKPGEPGFSEFMYFDGDIGKKFTDFIKSKGFDGAKLKETSEFSKVDFDTIVALDNAQVKSIKPSSGEIPKRTK